MRFLLLVGLIFIYLSNVIAQTSYRPIDIDYHHMLDRLDIMYDADEKIFTNKKPYQRSAVYSLIRSGLGSNEPYMPYLINDNWEAFDSIANKSEKPLLDTFYIHPSDFYEVNIPDFELHVNPIVGLSVGIDDNAEKMPFSFTRGVQLHGQIDEKVGFYTMFTENQVLFPEYVRDFNGRLGRQGVIPYAGFTKNWRDTGFDYLFTQGHINFNATKHVSMTLGYGKHFIGNGYRSLILSDFSNNYPFLEVKAKVWKLQYTYMIAQLISDIQVENGRQVGAERFPRKYFSFHHLSYNLLPNLTVGLSEAVVFNAEDTLDVNDDFDFSFLDPIIFFRAVETQAGSSENVVLAFDAKWNIKNRYSIYGQFVLDELVIDELKLGQGWWGNKYGIQIGGKYLNAFNVPNFDIQLEYNTVRPYTFTHSNLHSYTHYRMPLGHPLGANFREVISVFRYRFNERWSFSNTLMLSEQGLDLEGEHNGSNLLIPTANVTVPMTNGNETTQGVGTSTALNNFAISYMLKHNFFLDLNYVYRQVESDISDQSNTTNFLSLNIRWNMPRLEYVF